MTAVVVRLRAATPATATLAVDRLGEREVVLATLEGGSRRGAMTPADGAVLAAAARQALEGRLPLVLFLASSGADAAEGVAALAAWGEVARGLSRCSGVVPVLAVVTGPAISGSALLVGLADQVVMTRDAYAFVSGPVPVRVMTGVHVGVNELGGPAVHDRAAGTASVLVDDRDAAIDAVTELVSYLPRHADETAPVLPTSDPPDRSTPEAGACIPEHSAGSYDVRDVMTAISDDGHVMELRAGWAPNMVTALATMGGRPIGYVANQPLAIAGTLDIAASQKAARFVAFCDAFNLPIVTLVDTPGFYPGKDLEWRGMIRHGAQMAFAYARATVPRVAVVLRKSYGGAYIVMDSKSIGNDVYLAWPTAELAVMGASQAAEILHRRATPEERAQRVVEYEERHLNPYEAADRGYVDAVIDPADTRTALVDSLEALATKRERLVPRRHDNTPL